MKIKALMMKQYTATQTTEMEYFEIKPVIWLGVPYGLKTMKLKYKYALRSLSWDTVLKKTEKLYTTKLLFSHDSSRATENPNLKENFQIPFSAAPLHSDELLKQQCCYAGAPNPCRGWRQPVTRGTFPNNIYSAQLISFPQHFFKIPLIKQPSTFNLIYLLWVELQWHLP